MESGSGARAPLLVLAPTTPIPDWPTRMHARIIAICNCTTLHIFFPIMSDNPEGQAPPPGPSNGSSKTGCSPEILAAIYGSGGDKKAAYENSLRR